jgi:hypothetical protein
MVKYAVPIVYINGQAVAKLAQTVSSATTILEYLSCVNKIDSIQQLYKVPGRLDWYYCLFLCKVTLSLILCRRFKGTQGKAAACVTIQSAFRGFRVHRLYQQHRKENRAAYLIQRKFGSYFKYKLTKKKVIIPFMLFLISMK